MDQLKLYIKAWIISYLEQSDTHLFPHLRHPECLHCKNKPMNKTYIQSRKKISFSLKGLLMACWKRLSDLQNMRATPRVRPCAVWVTGQDAFFTGAVVILTSLKIHGGDFLQETHHQLFLSKEEPNANHQSTVRKNIEQHLGYTQMGKKMRPSLEKIAQAPELPCTEEERPPPSCPACLLLSPPPLEALPIPSPSASP